MADRFWFRCDGCRRSLRASSEGLWQLLAVFKPSAPVIYAVSAKEVRLKCYRCNLVHIFHSLTVEEALANM